MQQQPLQPNEVTRLLREARGGDRAAVDELFGVVYEELRRLSQRQMRQQKTNHTLQPTALVNEAYLRLVDEKQITWQNRSHFLALCAQTMRRILAKHARARHAEKRGGERARVPLEEGLLAGTTPLDFGELDVALEKLASYNSRMARIIEMRFFGGLSNRQVAQALGVSPETTKADWRTARAWLRQRLETPEEPTVPPSKDTP